MAQDQLSFATDIKPLFREKDRNAMRKAFDLWDRADVVAHGDAISKAVRSGAMPCDGAWPEQQAELLERWLKEGAPA